MERWSAERKRGGVLDCYEKRAGLLEQFLQKKRKSDVYAVTMPGRGKGERRLPLPAPQGKF